MKINILVALGAAILFASCGKDNVYSNDFSTATFVNASPGPPTLSLNVLIDTIGQGPGIPFRFSTQQLSVAPGTRAILLRSPNAIPAGTFTNFVTLPAEVFVTNKSYTYFVYDVPPSPGVGPLKTLRLEDDFKTVADGSIKIRFVPVATGAVPSDVTFLRNAPTGPSDSITISNLSYVGANPTAATLEALAKYVVISGPGTITIKMKNAGTQVVTATTTFSALFAGVNKGIFTAYSVGGTTGFPLGISVFRQFP